VFQNPPESNDRNVMDDATGVLILAVYGGSGSDFFFILRAPLASS
jgi:hypothetical protein